MICNIVKKGIGVGSVLFACATVTPALATNTVEVPVINRAMDTGEILNRKDLSIKTMELNHLPRGTVLTTDDLVGFELLRSLRAGTTVRADQVRTPPAARRGQEIVIHFEMPGIKLQAHGEAMEDGHEGERIKVLSKSSNKVLIGKVMGDGSVIVTQ